MENIKKIGVVYCATNNINNKKYIGQSINYKRRKYDHKKQPFNKRSGSYWCLFYRAIRKYGYDNFSWEILFEGNVDELDDQERYYIKKFNSCFLDGYNMTMGGVSLRGNDNPSFNHTTYHLININGKEETITPFDFKEKYGYEIRCLLNGKSLYTNGWCLYINKEFAFNNLLSKVVAKEKIHTFYNIYGNIEKLTREEMQNKYNDLKLGPLINNHNSSCKGWYLDKEKMILFHKTHIKYTLYNIYGESVETYNLTEFCKQKKIKRSLFISFLNDDDAHSCKGWYLDNDKIPSKYKKNNFVNKNTGVIENDISSYDLSIKYDLDTSCLKLVIDKKRHSHSGWMILY